MIGMIVIVVVPAFLRYSTCCSCGDDDDDDNYDEYNLVLLFDFGLEVLLLIDEVVVFVRLLCANNMSTVVRGISSCCWLLLFPLFWWLFAGWLWFACFASWFCFINFLWDVLNLNVVDLICLHACGHWSSVIICPLLFKSVLVLSWRQPHLGPKCFGPISWHYKQKYTCILSLHVYIYIYTGC